MVKIFLDTANIDEIREAASWGVLDGVTTNPTLVAKTGRKWSEVIQVSREIVEIFDHYDWDCEGLVASIRHPLHVIEAAKLGADIVTLPFDVLKKMTQHALTDVGLKRFLDDWAKVPK